MKCVRISELQIGSCLSSGVYTLEGNFLAKEGTPVTPHLISQFRKFNIHHVYITEAYEYKSSRKVFLNQELKESVEKGVSNVFKDLLLKKDISQTVVGVSDMLVESLLNDASIQICVNDIKLTNEYLFQHSIDVSIVGVLIGKEVGLSKSELRDLSVSGLLHDIGKTVVPQSILDKPAKLTDEEFRIIKKHPTYGKILLSQYSSLSDEIIDGVYQHHEKLDGSGYPNGLVGNKISDFAQILAVADVFDALVTERPYHKPYSELESTEMILAGTGQFNLDYVRAFVNAITLYPNNTDVLLSTGEHAIVIGQHRGLPLRPIVVVEGSNRLLDLALDRDCASITILNSIA